MDKLANYLNVSDAGKSLHKLATQLGATEFAQVRNLDYVLSPFDLYPLTPKVQPPLQRIVAFAVDMDGTSTTTEPLALHALEYMVRRITGRLEKSQWSGLDPKLDYPHVIGNSNFRHTEFLVQRHEKHIDTAAFCQAYFEAVCWTLACMDDPQRRRDVILNARNCGLSDLLADREFQTLIKSGRVDSDSVDKLIGPAMRKYGSAFRAKDGSERTAAALDIYYLRYHSILRELERGQGARLAAELLGPGSGRLVEPMPGYDVFVPLVRGWLGDEIDALYEPLRAYLLDRAELRYTAAQLDAWRPRLRKLAAHFQHRPARLSLVTASIAYETHACMKEIVQVMAEHVRDWPVPQEVRDRLDENLADYLKVYDGFVCASDTWEARLKPHRDLYSLALFQMSIPKTDYKYVVGLEDTEPGIIALRAAGIGCAVALPNHDTSRQNYTAATKTIRGGLPELMLAKNLLLANR